MNSAAFWFSSCVFLVFPSKIIGIEIPLFLTNRYFGGKTNIMISGALKPKLHSRSKIFTTNQDGDGKGQSEICLNPACVYAGIF